MSELKVQAKPDFTPLTKMLTEGVQSVKENDGYPGKDFEHYVFETAMECAFGKNVWEWWNKNANY